MGVPKVRLDNSKTYDFIIAGAGCAGLSLLHHLMQSPSNCNKQILVIDQSLQKSNDRTWCFWEKENGLFQNLVHHSWETISIHHHGFTKALKTSPFTYKMIQGLDYYQHIISLAKQRSTITWLEKSIKSISKIGELGQVNWEGGSAKASMVFSSIIGFNMNDLKSAETFSSTKKSNALLPFLWQHFKGRVVKYEQVVFDKQIAKLMDFNVPQHDATAFMYVLPLNEKEALVEYTLFSESVLPLESYDKVLDTYLEKLFPQLTYTIVHEEVGAIPMTQQTYQQNEAPIYYIGAVGNAVKPSTGYAFKFIQQQCSNIIVQLETSAPINTNVHNTRHRFYDAVLLEVLNNKKMTGAEIFTRIFKKNKAETVFKFLSNTSNIFDDINIMRSLPTGIFLPAALQILLRRQH